MRIGIIGAGNIGGALTRRLTALGHEVSVANSREPQTLSALAAETGAKAVTVREAARAGEVVVVTIPMKNIPSLPKDLFAGVPGDVAVIDTGNYYPQQRDGKIAGIEDGLTESRWVAQHCPPADADRPAPGRPRGMGPAGHGDAGGAGRHRPRLGTPRRPRPAPPAQPAGGAPRQPDQRLGDGGCGGGDCREVGGAAAP